MKCDAPFAAKYLRAAGYSPQVRLYESGRMYREENIVRDGHFSTFPPRMQVAEKRQEAHDARRLILSRKRRDGPASPERRARSRHHHGAQRARLHAAGR